VTVQGPQWLLLERRLMANPQYVGTRNVEVITMSDEWNGVSIAREDFEGPGWAPATRLYNLTRPRAEGAVSL
jgi:hypothetical protein